MFKLNEIKELIKIVDKSTIEEFEIENEGARLYISKPKPHMVQAAPIHTAPQAQPAVVEQPSSAPSSPEAYKEAAQVKDPGLYEITSPMVGTFYGSPSPGADSYVQIGDKVKESSVVCIVEAMKLMNEIEAEVKGEIVEILVENSQLVEFGQPLFLVKPD